MANVVISGRCVIGGCAEKIAALNAARAAFFAAEVAKTRVRNNGAKKPAETPFLRKEEPVKLSMPAKMVVPLRRIGAPVRPGGKPDPKDCILVAVPNPHAMHVEMHTHPRRWHVHTTGADTGERSRC